MGNNIVLIGMPGVGKSYYSKKISTILDNYTVFDIDSIIEKTLGLSVADIFKNYSEDYFRKLEYDTIKNISHGKNKILSIGGGAFENPDTRNTLLNFGIVFYLKSDLEVLSLRVSKDRNRPLLQDKNPLEALGNLLEKREENYKKAHFTVDTTLYDDDEIVRYIIGKANEITSAC